MSELMQGSLRMSAAMVLSGTIGWFVVASGQPVVDVVFWRCVLGAPVLLTVCLAFGLLRGYLTWRLLGLALLGGVALVLNWLLLFAAYSHASIAIATAVYNTQPFMLVALSALLFGERLTRDKFGWLLLAFGGVLAIVQAKPSASYLGDHYLLGFALALGAAFCYALVVLTTKAMRGVPPHLIALIQVGVGMLMLAPFANLAELPGDLYTWSLLGTLGVVHTGVVFILIRSDPAAAYAHHRRPLVHLSGHGDPRRPYRLRPSPAACATGRNRRGTAGSGRHDPGLDAGSTPQGRVDRLTVTANRAATAPRWQR